MHNDLIAAYLAATPGTPERAAAKAALAAAVAAQGEREMTAEERAARAAFVARNPR